MPEVKKPRSGSLQFWPRKRAKRIYPHFSTYPPTAFSGETAEKPRLLAFAGYKATMLHIMARDAKKGSATFGEDIRIPVTVLDCPAMVAVAVRAYKRTPYGMALITEAWAEKLPKDLELSRKTKAKGKGTPNAAFAKMEKEADMISSLRVIAATQPTKSGFGKHNPELLEIEVGGKSVADRLNFAKSVLGSEIKPSDVMKEGEVIDVIAITKGKGMQGPVKRFGVVIQNRHAKHKRRHVGSLGQEQPGKVRWTVPMAGQLGLQQRTEHNKRVLKLNEAADAGKEVTPASGINKYGVVRGPYVMLEGSVPGPKKRLVVLRVAMRPAKHRLLPYDIREVVK
ncbi:MAG: 50S ribosomal protein L3 [Candidatus Aenigmatarchaeota archaeon]